MKLAENIYNWVTKDLVSGLHAVTVIALLMLSIDYYVKDDLWLSLFFFILLFAEGYELITTERKAHKDE